MGDVARPCTSIPASASLLRQQFDAPANPLQSGAWQSAQLTLAWAEALHAEHARRLYNGTQHSSPQTQLATGSQVAPQAKVPQSQLSSCNNCAGNAHQVFTISESAHHYTCASVGFSPRHCLHGPTSIEQATN